MSEPTMTLPNGDTLRDGEWGLTRQGNRVRVKNSGLESHYSWDGGRDLYTSKGKFYFGADDSDLDIIARAPAASLELQAFVAMYHAAKAAGLI